MSYRRANNLSTFFPDKYGKESDHESSDYHREPSYQRKDTYVPSSSHKDIFVPNRSGPKPASIRTYPVRQSYNDDAHYSSPRPTSTDRRKDRYVPSPAPASSKSPSLANGFSDTNGSNEEPFKPQTPTPNIPLSITTPENKEDIPQWRTFSNVKYSAQSHYLLENGDFKIDEKVISQLHKAPYFAVYDPEIKKDPSKGNMVIYHKFEESDNANDPRKLSDKSGQHLSKKYKKYPFKSLPIPKLTYDKNSVGGPPPNEIVISGLSKAFNETYLRNELKTHGEVLEFENIMDPSTGTPLGIIRIRFGGSISGAYRSARHAVSALDGSKIDLNTIRAGINEEGKLLESLKSKEIQIRIAKIKQAEINDKKIAPPSAPKAILKAISKSQGPINSVAHPTVKPINSPKSSIPYPDPVPAKKQEVSEVTTEKKFVVPAELDKYVKGRPFIFIASKYVKGKVEKTDVKKALETYDWTRVLFDLLGVFIVFNSAKEAQRCYQFENGKRLLTVNLYMDLHLPEGYKVEDDDKNYASTQRDVIEEATSLLAKELESAVQKDIRTKIIAPAVLDFLNIDNFPELKAKLVAPPPIKKPSVQQSVQEVEWNVSSIESKQDDSTLDVFSLQRKLPKIPTLKKKEKLDETKDTKSPKKKKHKKALPMSYRLNFENDSESDFRESTVSTPQLEAHYKDENEDDEGDEVGPPKKKSKITQKSKKHRPLLYSSSSEDDEDAEEEEEDDTQAGKVKESQPTTPETPEADKMDVETAPVQQDVLMEDEVEKDDENVDFSNIEKRFRPTTTDVPCPVYEEQEDLLLDIDGIQSVVKDDEDLELLKEIYNNNPPKTRSKYPEYTLWKLKYNKATSESKSNVKKSIAEDYPKYLANETGSHRSQGYAKISDELKIEYLPHRKRVHDPLNTIQVENEETESSKVQSSRVNRANNRRFAYEVSTFNNQNEILTLNQLNKRKKPVSFARSAIHNWGLYALEPIAQKEMIIEYVGERIRQQVADFREKAYLKSGIGSSYLFRIDENTVIDATKKGGIARFINHCCQPSCTAKIIKVEGQKRIVIYALRDIAANEELTYDYKFERETNDNERVRCLCGAPGCKGYLN